MFTPQDEQHDRGSHGMFDDTAHGRDPWSWSSMHRGALAGAGLLGAVAVARRRP